MELENETKETTETKETETEKTTETKESTDNGEKGNGEKQSVKSFSQDDIDAAVKKAVAETKAEMEKQAKLAKLPEDEKRQEELRLKEEDYEKRNAELNRRELMQDARDMLSEKGIPVSFAKRLLGADKKETKANVDEFAKEWSSNISAAVDEKLKGKTPKAGGGKEPADPFLEGLGL